MDIFTWVFNVLCYVVTILWRYLFLLQYTSECCQYHYVTADDSLLIAMLEQDPVLLVKPGAVLLKTPLHLPPLSGL